MATEIKRKTGKDLKKDYQDNIIGTNALVARIKNRATELCEKYPDAPIGYYGAVGRELEKLGYITTSTYIDIIIAIEKYLADLHPHKQTKITF